MNKFYSVLYYIILLLCMSSCSKSHSVHLENISSIKVVYVSDNNQSEEKLYSEGSSELAFLKQWLRSNTKGWQTFVGTQPISTLYISGNEFWLNINKNSAILGYKSGENEYTELVKDISYSDFNALKIKP